MSFIIFIMVIIPIVFAMIWGRINGLPNSESEPFKGISRFCMKASFVTTSISLLLLIALIGFRIGNAFDIIST